MPTCAVCHAQTVAGDRYCSECGARIAAPDPVVGACACGGTQFDADGFCDACGRPRHDPLQENGLIVGPGLAALSDRGLVHDRNEDAFMVSGPPEGGPGTIVIVSDGVSQSQVPHMASAVAVKVAHASVLRSLSQNVPPDEAIRTAIVAAHAAVCELPFDRQIELDPPAATIVVAAILDRDLVVGWLGDSRIYLVSEGSASLLTRDHSWQNDAVDRGLMTEAAAAVDSKARALTACLGATDFMRPTPCPPPAIARHRPDGPSWLVACTDGVWTHAEHPARMVDIAGSGDAADRCRRLVALSLSEGGRDNITAAIARMA